jgi:hypothetical protein
MPRTSLRLAFALVALVATAGGALAQSAACRQARADLAGLGSGGSRTAMRLAQEQLGEIGRMQGQMRALQCDQGGFFGPSPDCQAVAQRIRAMEANYGALRQRAQAEGDVEQRRRRLQAAIDRFCDVEPTVEPVRATRAAPEPEAREGRRAPTGGGRMVCVRACDGFFFPLQNLPSGRGDADDMCQALCPGTETTAYAMPGGDDALNQAISIRTNRPYVQSPNAFKFQKSFDPACSCKKQGESWAQLLRQAESMLDQRRGDIIVTEQKAEELSRPKAAPPLTAAQQREQDRRLASRRVNDAAEAQAAAEAGAAAPTASGESSGIGRTIETARVIGRAEGERREIAGPDGAKRTIRVIATTVIPVPQTAR